MYFATRNAKLKRTIVELLGDMSRIHMKYFRSKANYKTHIENIVLVFGNIIESL